jgi:prophage antirepressor-like protein
MNDLQIFNNKEFGNVRAVVVNDLPWFVGKDVCEAFGDTNYRRSLSNIDESDKGVSQIDTPGGKQNMVVINESGLYSLLFQMQPQKAKGVSQNDALINERIEKLHRFKHWVTSEVLPSIRKTGSYSKPLTTSEQIRLLAQGNTELTERVDKVEDKITSIEEETPLYGCEIEEVQKHVRKKGIEVLGGKDSNAYKDGGIRGSVYSDIYKQLKREFGCVATYKSIKRKYLADVHEFIDTYLLPIALAEVVHDTNM